VGSDREQGGGSARRFIARTSTLLGGSVAARLVVLASMPVVTRLFSPADFGVAAVFVAIVGVASVLATLRYEDAVLLPDDEDEAIDAGLVALAALLVATVLVTAAVLAVHALGLGGGLGGWLLLLPLAIFLTGLANVLAAWALRHQRARTIAASEIALAGTLTGVRLGAGAAFGSSVGGLVAAVVAGRLARAAALLRGPDLPGARAALRRARDGRRRLARAARAYRDFPLYSAPTSALRHGTRHLPVLALGAIFAPAIVGLYAVANRLMESPLSPTIRAVQRTYFADAAARRNDGRPLTGAFLKTTAALAAAGAGPAAVIMIWGEPLFALVLGADWEAAGRYAGVLAPWIVSRLMLAPTLSTFVVARRQDWMLRIQALAATASVVAFAATWIARISPEQGLALFAAVNVALNLYMILQAYRLSAGSRAARAGGR